jgi:hypothetical protein
MSKFTFTFEGTPSPGRHTKNTVEFNAVTLGDIIPEFEKFLLGLGYILPSGVHIGFQDDNIDSDDDGVDNWNITVSE